jgi:hypothetical protein
MADPYLEKPKPSRSLPLFDLKRPRRAHTLPHLVPTRSQRDSLSRIIRNASETAGSSSAHPPDACLPCYITAAPRIAVGPIEQHADVGG